MKQNKNNLLSTVDFFLIGLVLIVQHAILSGKIYGSITMSWAWVFWPIYVFVILSLIALGTTKK